VVSQRQRAGPGNVPVELTSFAGRTGELAEVKRLLAAARVVTLADPEDRQEPAGAAGGASAGLPRRAPALDLVAFPQESAC